MGQRGMMWLMGYSVMYRQEARGTASEDGGMDGWDVRSAGRRATASAWGSLGSLGAKDGLCRKRCYGELLLLLIVVICQVLAWQADAQATRAAEIAVSR